MNPILSAVLVVVIAISTAIIILNAISLITEEHRQFQSFEEAKYIMSNVRSVMNELLFEASGARRSINLQVNGKFIVNGNEDSIKYKLPNFELEPGTIKEENSIQIISGPVMSAYEKDIDNDGTTDLVLENEFVLFAIRKESSTVNTSDMITMIRNKDTNISVVPISTILINDMLNTSYGNGYTELTQKGYDIPSSSILVSVNSNEGTDYTAIFTLVAGSDFVELEVIL